MRVVLLRRSARGGMAAHVDDLAAYLPQRAYSVVVEDATWMPRETGRSVDRDVSRHLRDLAEGFDILHVFGYRAAWACAEAFGQDVVWLYTAYEPPPSSPALIERLNMASLGFCASAMTRNALSGMGVHSLDLVYPGVGTGIGVRLGAEETRRMLEVPEDRFLVGSFSDEGLIDAAANLEDATVIVADRDGGKETGVENAFSIGWLPRPRDFMSACDLWVGPERNQGYVRGVAEAMFEGTAVLVRESVREMIEEDLSGFVYSGDDALAKRIPEIQEMGLTRQTVGAAGRVRALEAFDVEARTADIAQRYRDVVEETYELDHP